MNLLSLNLFKEWNPQLVREIKGRFRLPNILITIGISVLCQMIVFFRRLDGFPGININPRVVTELKLFYSISILAVFVLIVGGTYMLINDLATEERRGTLNFIRLSPQSAQSIFIGKLLGVPSLLYLGVFLTIPFHLWAGISAKMPLLTIVIFYCLTVGSCIFFYSLALLFRVATSAGLHELQSLLGSGMTLIFLIANQRKFISLNSDWTWTNIFSPTCLLSYFINCYLENNNDNNYYTSSSLAIALGHNHSLYPLKWFKFIIGGNGVSLLGFALLNYGFLTYWIWQVLKRNYNHPNLPALTKKQSYLLTSSFTLMNLGFIISDFEYNFSNGSLFIGNLFLILVLMLALFPQQQTLQDWARYRRERKNHFWIDLAEDLIWGEKSPAIVAIFINLLIASTIWIVPISLAHREQDEMFLAVVLHFSFMLLCASIAQLIMMMKTPKRTLWATGAVLTLLAIPLLLIVFMFSETDFVWSVFYFVSIGLVPTSSILISFLCQLLIIILCNIQLTRLLKKAGESEMKALVSS